MKNYILLLSLAAIALLTSCDGRNGVEYIPFQEREDGRWGLVSTDGKVLFSIFSFHVTDGSLIDAFSRSLRLSGGVALSQAFSASIRPGNGIIGRTISAFGMLLSSFKASEGSFTERIQSALSGECIENQQKTAEHIPDFTLIAVSLTITTLCIADCIFF